MKNLFKNTLFILLILGALSACQSVKDGLTGKKQTNSDEFLVKKKIRYHYHQILKIYQNQQLQIKMMIKMILRLV